MILTPTPFGQTALALQESLTYPLQSTQRQILSDIDALQRTLTDGGEPSPHLESVRIYVGGLPWGDDIAHQVCGGVRALLQKSALCPRHEEDIEKLHARYRMLLRGEVATYTRLENLRQSKLSRVDRVCEDATGKVYVKKTYERVASFGLADSGLYNEARFSALVGSRGAVQVVDYGIEPTGQPFLIFENMKGDLRKIFDPGKRRDVYQESKKLSALLLYTHFHRIIHRDIKPTNVMVDEQGNYFLSDFGLAAYDHELDHLPPDCYGYGTPSYMPPEMRVDHPPRPSFNTDVYAMGLTLLETITGRFLPPDQSMSGGISKLLGIRDQSWLRYFRRVLEDDGNAQWQLERLVTIINKATALNPASRYPNGASLFNDVNDTLAPGIRPILYPLAEAFAEKISPSSRASALMSSEAETVVDIRSHPEHDTD